MADKQPIYDPGHAITGRATGAAVSAGRFVQVAATKVDGQPTPIKHALAAGAPIGAIQEDAAEGGTVSFYGQGFALPILVGGTGATAGAYAEVLDTGTVQDRSAGTKVGVFLETKTATNYALVLIQF